MVVVLLGALVFGASGKEGSIVYQGGLGAKALGMGGAFCALADDGMAALWNPAGILAFGENVWIAGATSQKFGAVPFQVLSGGFSFAGYGIGLMWASASDRTDSIKSLKIFDSNLFGGTVALKLGDFGWVGANIKYYIEKVQDKAYSGFGFDLGVIVPLMPELALGVVAKDLGTSLSGESVSTLYVAGFAVKLLDGALKLVADVELSGTFAVDHLRAGLEFALIENLAIRAGLTVPKMNFDKYYVAVGVGFALGGLSVDAAYVLAKNPGESLVLSATFLLGELVQPAPAPTPTPAPAPTPRPR
ncbi:MAG: hypothetical protein ABDI20_04215 [Candidatus Bipolaricaulaceae bacterium]